MSAIPASESQQQARREEALRLVSAKRYPEAERLYRQLLEEGEKDLQLLNNLAIVCGAQGQLDRKIELLKQAVVAYPDDRATRFTLAFAHLERKQAAEALALYRALLAEGPEEAEAHRGAGRALALLKQPHDALVAFRRACELAPDQTQHWLDLGRELGSGEAHGEAETCLRRAADLDPGNGEVALALATELRSQGRVEDALAAMRAALAVRPDNYGLLVELGIYLQELGRDEEALEFFFYATSIEPGRSTAVARTALSLLRMNDLQQALELLAMAEEMDPLDVTTLNMIGICFSESGFPSRAMGYYEKLLKIDPARQDVLGNLAVTHQLQGNPDEAIAIGRRALAYAPFAENVVHNLMFTFSTAADRWNSDALALAGDYATHVRASLPPLSLQDLRRQPFSAAAPRSLRIGFLTAEIGDHVVGRFMDSFLRHYDRSAFHVELLSVARRFEARGDELAQRADGAHSLEGLNDQAARTFLRERQYDILVDTSGFTRSTGIALLVQRCAPIQCHYIGYHATTGLDTIDYFIGDGETASADLQPQFVERLWRLPRPWLASVAEETPPPAVSVAETPRPILGSFNQLAKVREQTLAHWGAALQAVPEALLVIKDRLCVDERIRERILAALEPFGAGLDRIRFLGMVPSQRDHLAMYNQIDVALDATPWSSATTGVEALSMGVPLVAIRGHCMAARMSTSLVKAVGHPEWVAEDPTSFAAIVAGLCADVEGVRRRKPELQAQVLAGPLFDAADLATHLGKAFQEMAAEKLAG